MTLVKMCGLRRACDIEAANELRPDYVGFVFANGSKRYVSPEEAKVLRSMLDPGISAVGVFVDADPSFIEDILDSGTIDMIQLHGNEDGGYIDRLRSSSSAPIVKAFRIGDGMDVDEIMSCPADHIMLDSGAGTGNVFDWNMIENMNRPYFLAGGLSADNVEEAIERLHPFAVDVSSGIETDGFKDKTKMAAFVAAVRRGDRQ
ncbi:MAG: phosphoribosylanthranilate isomerase [Candidatus Methanomethylophilaceae archaeon]|nr:phosphoribosylanthranilate isomerase [Candidatus Methanomethylophilaceae archaeon]